MLDHDLGAPRPAVGGASGAVDDLQQFGDGHARRSRLVEVLVSPFEGDHQVLRRRQQSVQEELAVLTGEIPVADFRPGQQQVVTVLARSPGEKAIVQAEQAHHPVGYRPHWQQGANSHVPGAKVGPRGPAPEPVGQQGASLGQVQQHLIGTPSPRLGGLIAQSLQSPP
ncbi:MAG: hypothetical protein ACLP9C_06775 [Acidimicrobiales bacterium]